MSNVQKVPIDKPTILCANHPNGFLEPCLLACFLPMPLHFLVRGDLFSVKWLKWMLVATNQIPIFRFRDGFSNLRGNDSSFKYCFQVLKENKHILIFPEGSTEQVRHIRKLQKGPARMAFGSMEEFAELDVHILPVHMHFTSPRKFRSEVLIDFGDAIQVRNYKKLYEKEPMTAVQELTTEIHERMKSISVHVENDKQWPVIENIWHWQNTETGNAKALPVFENNSELLPAFVSRIKAFFLSSNSSKTHIESGLKAYFSKLDERKLRDQEVKPGISGWFFNLIGLAIGIIPAIIGFIGNFLPLFMAKLIADAKVKDMEFYSSIMLSVAMTLYPIYFLVLLILSLFIFGTKAWIILLLPFLGYFVILYWEHAVKFIKQIRWKMLPKVEKQFLMESRINISEALQNL